MRKLLLASAVFVLGATSANAALIASFSQNPSVNPTVTATDNGTTTNIQVNSQSTSITAGNGSILGNAFFSLNATSDRCCGHTCSPQ